MTRFTSISECTDVDKFPNTGICTQTVCKGVEEDRKLILNYFNLTVERNIVKILVKQVISNERNNKNKIKQNKKSTEIKNEGRNIENTV